MRDERKEWLLKDIRRERQKAFKRENLKHFLYETGCNIRY